MNWSTRADDDRPTKGAIRIKELEKDIVESLQKLNDEEKEEAEKAFEQGCIQGFLAGLKARKEG